MPCSVLWTYRASIKTDWTACPTISQASATAEKLEVICAYDFADLEELEPPRGFGRD